MSEKKAEEEKLTNTKSIAVQVPAVAPSALKTLVGILQHAGLPLSRALLADRLVTTISSSGFMQKIAAARYYGFIEPENGKLSLTERGERFAAGDNAAAQEGFMGSTFGPIVLGLVGRAVDVSTIALHLTEKNRVPVTSATRLASVLYRSAREVGLLGAKGFDAGRLEELQSNLARSRSNDAPARVVEQTSSPVLEPSVQTSLTTANLPSTHIPIAKGLDLAYSGDRHVELLINEKFATGLKSLKEAMEEVHGVDTRASVRGSSV